jgi:hypothetical protein
MNFLTDNELIDWSRPKMEAFAKSRPDVSEITISYITKPSPYVKALRIQKAEIRWTKTSGGWEPVEVIHLPSENNYDEIFHGKAYADAIKGFRKDLADIEKRHKKYFTGRPSRFFSKEHDDLNDHWMLATDRNMVLFNFHPDSDLRSDIREECNRTFRKWFP